MSPAPRGLSRRGFLAGLGAATAGAVALGSGISGCSAPRLSPVPLPSTVADESRTRRVVRFANWYGNIDVSPGGGHPTLAEFTRQTRVKVAYTPLFADANQAIGLIGMPLAAGRDPGYDLIVVPDWVLAQFTEHGWAARLSPGLLPQARRLLPVFRDWPVPRVCRYSLPWQGDFTGIAYNMDVTRRPVTSMTDLLTAHDLHGRVSLVTGMRDVMGLILLDQGSNPASFTDAEFGGALATLRQSVDTGQIRLVSRDYVPPLVRGRTAAGVAYSGDILYAHSLNPAVRFTWPDTGGMLWTDNMVIPSLSPARANAERLMDFYYQPGVAARLSAYLAYISPVAGAQAAMREVNPVLAGEKYVFPPESLLGSSHFFKILSREQIDRYTGGFESAVGLLPPAC